jgi:hypothetical protein
MGRMSPREISARLVRIRQLPLPEQHAFRIRECPPDGRKCRCEQRFSSIRSPLRLARHEIPADSRTREPCSSRAAGFELLQENASRNERDSASSAFDARRGADSNRRHAAPEAGPAIGALSPPDWTTSKRKRGHGGLGRREAFRADQGGASARPASRRPSFAFPSSSAATRRVPTLLHSWERLLREPQVD